MTRGLLGLLFALVAQVASAATVSTIGVVTNTVTVTTSAAHGFAVNQGVCLINTPACVVIATAPTSTSFTFAQPSNQTVAACASSCGTAIAAPKVIVLDTQQPDQAHQAIHYLLWLTTITPIPNSGASSGWKAGAGSVGASAAQNSALTAGAFIEVNQTVSFPSSLTTAQVQVFLQNDYLTRQAALAANTQPGAFYGSVWDGTAWTIQ